LSRNEESSLKNDESYSTNKPLSRNASKRRRPPPDSPHSSMTDLADQAWSSIKARRPPASQAKSTQRQRGVTGVGREVYSTPIKTKNVQIPTPSATYDESSTALSQPITSGTMGTCSGTTSARMTDLTEVESYEETTLRERRRKKGNGLGMKSETGQCVGRALITNGCSGPDKRDRDGTDAWAGASVEDSRLNPRLGSRTSMGGGVTILSHFSFLPSCDSAIDLLPDSSLTYCTDIGVRGM
jgi:hypothetical protein